MYEQQITVSDELREERSTCTQLALSCGWSRFVMGHWLQVQ